MISNKIWIFRQILAAFAEYVKFISDGERNISYPELLLFTCLQRILVRVGKTGSLGPWSSHSVL